MPDLSEPIYNPSAGYDPYPDNEEGWKSLYDFRWQCYLHHPYGGATQKKEHLFRAFDDSGNEIDQTRRIFRWYQFVVDTDTRALAPGRLILELNNPDVPRAQLAQGERIWRRSHFAQHQLRWFTQVCALGDGWMEAVRTSPKPPYNTKIVFYDPRNVTSWYDAETGTELEKVEIEIGYLDNPARVNPADETFQSYKRVLTRTRIDVYRNGEHVPAESGEHGLGVVPCVHLQAIPFDQPEHSLPAPAGIERPLMKMDSLATQMGAIGNRYANPTLALFGFKVGPSSDVQRFGRMIDGAPADGRAEYLEAKSASIPGLLSSLQELDRHIRDTSPEVLFASDSAQESAEARSLRANAFEAKMETMRAGIFAALVEVTGYALAMDAGQAWGDDFDVFEIDAPPILPRNIKAELEHLHLIKADLTHADYVRHLQRLGFVARDVEPNDYNPTPNPPGPTEADAVVVSDAQLASDAIDEIEGALKEGDAEGALVALREIKSLLKPDSVAPPKPPVLPNG